MGKKIIIKGADFYQNRLPIPNELCSEDFVGEWIQGSISTTDGSVVQKDYLCCVESFIDVTGKGLNTIEVNDCGLSLSFYDTNKDFIGHVETTNEPLSFTTPSETKYVRLTLWKTNVPITPTIADTLVWKVRKL
jgi:hypothetical protein